MSWMVLMALVTALACGLRSESGALLPMAGASALLAAWAGPLVATAGSWVLCQRLKQGRANERWFANAAQVLESCAVLLWSLGNALWCCQATPLNGQALWGEMPAGLLPLVNVMSLLLPVLMLLGITWMGLFQLQWGWYAASLLRGDVCHHEPRLLPFLWRQYRQSVLPLIVPALVMLLLQGLCATILPESSQATLGMLADGSAGGASLWVYGILTMAVLLIVVLVSPLVIRLSWPSAPLADPLLQASMQATLAASGCRVREIRVWKSQRRSFNAAVVGYVSPLRYLFVTERLTFGLAPGSLNAVLRHEAAHVACSHLLKRLLCMSLLGLVWHLLSGVSWQAWFASVGISAPVAMVGLWLLVALYVVLVVGGYSRLLEYEADAAVCFDPFTHTLDRTAGEQLIVALRRISHGTAGTDWMHPPLAKRIAFLHAIMADPAVATRYRKRLALIPYVLIVVGVFLLVGIVV